MIFFGLDFIMQKKNDCNDSIYILIIVSYFYEFLPIFILIFGGIIFIIVFLYNKIVEWLKTYKIQYIETNIVNAEDP